ncbi:hypothetical protein PLICRDRAFT_57498 [Plicaturopsis crispa FD-325 SS-3]|uniref:F-box domain-containing protein n=1 Tax=Plicaturopsis crispa FD-325 SS-3 TaxID=944288 RepID=A0A0C9SXP8_PLICR|nr:hypothetical protein PLICRDRAFT_57498 [Plicaturopsis crispa FD-325 SS-3]
MSRHETHKSSYVQPEARMSRLPSELCDIVIGYLWDDPHALASCGAVCRSWIPASRHLLFSDQNPRVPALYSSRPSTVTESNAAVFSALLDSPHCSFKSTLSFLRFASTKRKAAFPRSSPFHAARSILLKLSTLRSLRRLDILFDDFSDISDEDWQGLTSSISLQLRDLRLHLVSFANLDQMLGLISAYPALQVLCLTKMTTFIGLDSHITSVSARAFLRSLLTLNLPKYDQFIADTIIRWLHHYPPPLLQNLAIPLGGGYSPMDHYVFAFVKNLGASLRRLEITRKDWRVDLEDSQSLDLSSNTNLRILDLGCVYLRHGALDRDGLPVVLSSITSTHVEHIGFGISNSARDWWGSAALIWQILAGPRFARLEEIVVSVPESDLPYLRDNLADCEVRGLLRIRAIPARALDA